MRITNRDIDGGKPFDWGKTSLDYAKFRDIYPKEFYQNIAPDEFDILHYGAVAELKKC